MRCDEFTLGSSNNWATVVSGKSDSFAAQIAANTVEGVAEVLSPGFSGTTAAEDIAQKVVVMDICKNFFSYRCRTLCGGHRRGLGAPSCGGGADARSLRAGLR